jgi:hypothetical protein
LLNVQVYGGNIKIIYLNKLPHALMQIKVTEGRFLSRFVVTSGPFAHLP